MSYYKKYLKYKIKYHNLKHSLLDNKSINLFDNKELNNINLYGGANVEFIYNNIIHLKTFPHIKCSKEYNNMVGLTNKYLFDIITRLKNNDYAKFLILHLSNNRKIDYKLLNNVNIPKNIFIKNTSNPIFNDIHTKFISNFKHFVHSCETENNIRQLKELVVPSNILPNQTILNMKEECLDEIPAKIDKINKIITKNNSIYKNEEKKMYKILAHLEEIKKIQKNNTVITQIEKKNNKEKCREYMQMVKYASAKGELHSSYFPDIPTYIPIKS